MNKVSACSTYSAYNPYNDGISYLKKYGKLIEEHNLEIPSKRVPFSMYFFRDLNQFIKEYMKGSYEVQREQELNEYLTLWMSKDEEIIKEGLHISLFETAEEFEEFFRADVPAIDYVRFTELLKIIIKDIAEENKSVSKYIKEVL